MLAYLLTCTLIASVLLASLGRDPRAGRGARHRAAGLPRLIKGDGPATVTGLARAANRRAVVIPPSGPSTGQLQVIQ